MIRHYYIADKLDDLDDIEQDLGSQGFTEPQIHVLSEHDAEVEAHNLHEVEPVLKLDVVHSTEIWSAIGIVSAILSLIIAYSMGWTESPAGWIPFIFLAIIILGFCTWEGGLIGIHKPNVNFARFQELLHKGKHILFVDVEPEQELIFDRIMKSHPNLIMAGVGEATPQWVVRGQDGFRRFVKFMP